MANAQQTKILTSKDTEALRYPLPKSWQKAAGLLRHKRKALERHLRTVHGEWGRRSRHA